MPILSVGSSSGSTGGTTTVKTNMEIISKESELPATGSKDKLYYLKDKKQFKIFTTKYEDATLSSITPNEKFKSVDKVADLPTDKKDDIVYYVKENKSLYSFDTATDKFIKINITATTGGSTEPVQPTKLVTPLYEKKDNVVDKNGIVAVVGPIDSIEVGVDDYVTIIYDKFIPTFQHKITLKGENSMFVSGQKELTVSSNEGFNTIFRIMKEGKITYYGMTNSSKALVDKKLSLKYIEDITKLSKPDNLKEEDSIYLTTDINQAYTYGKLTKEIKSIDYVEDYSTLESNGIESISPTKHISTNPGTSKYLTLFLDSNDAIGKTNKGNNIFYGINTKDGFQLSEVTFNYSGSFLQDSGSQETFSVFSLLRPEIVSYNNENYLILGFNANTGTPIKDTVICPPNKNTNTRIIKPVGYDTEMPGHTDKYTGSISHNGIYYRVVLQQGKSLLYIFTASTNTWKKTTIEADSALTELTAGTDVLENGSIAIVNNDLYILGASNKDIQGTMVKMAMDTNVVTTIGKDETLAKYDVLGASYLDGTDVLMLVKNKGTLAYNSSKYIGILNTDTNVFQIPSYTSLPIENSRVCNLCIYNGRVSVLDYANSRIVDVRKYLEYQVSITTEKTEGYRPIVDVNSIANKVNNISGSRYTITEDGTYVITNNDIKVIIIDAKHKVTIVHDRTVSSLDYMIKLLNEDTFEDNTNVTRVTNPSSDIELCVTSTYGRKRVYSIASSGIKYEFLYRKSDLPDVGAPHTVYCIEESLEQYVYQIADNRVEPFQELNVTVNVTKNLPSLTKHGVTQYLDQGRPTFIHCKVGNTDNTAVALEYNTEEDKITVVDGPDVAVPDKLLGGDIITTTSGNRYYSGGWHNGLANNNLYKMDGNRVTDIVGNLGFSRANVMHAIHNENVYTIVDTTSKTPPQFYVYKPGNKRYADTRAKYLNGETLPNGGTLKTYGLATVGDMIYAVGAKFNEMDLGVIKYDVIKNTVEHLQPTTNIEITDTDLMVRAKPLVIVDKIYYIKEPIYSKVETAKAYLIEYDCRRVHYTVLPIPKTIFVGRALSLNLIGGNLVITGHNGSNTNTVIAYKVNIDGIETKSRYVKVTSGKSPSGLTLQLKKGELPTPGDDKIVWLDKDKKTLEVWDGASSYTNIIKTPDIATSDIVIGSYTLKPGTVNAHIGGPANLNFIEKFPSRGGITFDLPNSRFIIPSDGYYYIAFNGIDSNTSSNVTRVQIFNNEELITSAFTNNSSDLSCMVCKELKQGDTLRVYLETGEIYNHNGYDGSNYVNFNIFKIIDSSVTKIKEVKPIFTGKGTQYLGGLPANTCLMPNVTTIDKGNIKPVDNGANDRYFIIPEEGEYQVAFNGSSAASSKCELYVEVLDTSTGDWNYVETTYAHTEWTRLVLCNTHSFKKDDKVRLRVTLGNLAVNWFLTIRKV